MFPTKIWKPLAWSAATPYTSFQSRLPKAAWLWRTLAQPDSQVEEAPGNAYLFLHLRQQRAC